MRAIQITELTGPDGARSSSTSPEPEPSHLLTPGEGVVVDVHAAGVSFPEVLQTRGEYQFKPPLPFVPGSEVGGRRAQRPGRRGGSRRATASPRSRVLGGFAEVAVAPAFLTFTLPDALDFAQGAALILNYHTAYFALKLRGRLREGETRARARRRRRRRHRGAAGGARASARARSRSSPATRRSGSRARPAPTRWCAPTGRGRTQVQGAHRRRRRRRARPGRRRPLHRQPALAARGRARSSSSASPAARSPR